MTAAFFPTALDWAKQSSVHWSARCGHFRLHVVTTLQPPTYASVRYHWSIDDSYATLHAGSADTPEAAAMEAESRLLLLGEGIVAELTRRR